MSDSSERRTTFSIFGGSPKKSGFRATDLETGMSMEVIEVEVLGVRITNRLLAKGFAGLLGQYTLMQSLGMGGEERA